ncbi:hypothetical protein IID21_02890 [Patescibacteria group bacterium]|nr:hypothetical protein [Patescibacteria group bacterium]
MTRQKKTSQPAKAAAHSVSENETTETQVKKHLTDYIGVELEDIENEDSLAEDLHMSASDVSEFIERLGNQGLDTSSLVLEDIKSVSDLIESISSEELG